MSRPGRDPAEILAAQRAGTRQRLIVSGTLVERVDEPLAAFDGLPERHGGPWDGEAAYRWVLERRRRSVALCRCAECPNRATAGPRICIARAWEPDT
jgi:hypothetical protein